MDAIALWIGRTVIVTAGISALVALVALASEWWWRKIGKEARVILMTAWQERAKIKLARERATKKGGEDQG